MTSMPITVIIQTILIAIGTVLWWKDKRSGFTGSEHPLD